MTIYYPVELQTGSGKEPNNFKPGMYRYFWHTVRFKIFFHLLARPYVTLNIIHVLSSQLLLHPFPPSLFNLFLISADSIKLRLVKIRETKGPLATYATRLGDLHDENVPSPLP